MRIYDATRIYEGSVYDIFTEAVVVAESSEQARELLQELRDDLTRGGEDNYWEVECLGYFFYPEYTPVVEMVPKILLTNYNNG